MSVNKAILVGFVGNDPEVKYLDSGTPMAKFSLATSENYTNRSGEKVSQTEWHNIVLWRALAEVTEKYVKKGSQIYIEGRIRTRSWEDKDGNKRYTTEINADTMQLLGKRGDGGGSVQGQSQSQGENTQQKSVPAADQNTSAPDVDGADDLPF